MRRSLVLGTLVLAALGLIWAAQGRGLGQERAAAKPSAGKGEGRPEDRPVPVFAVTVERRDLPVLRDGLGTVTAYKTVTVRSRVDGRLDRVAFTEGQAVKRGTLLAEVDPRPFRIQLAQAQAARARDAAQLQAAKLTLERFTAVRKENLIAQQQVDDQRALVAQVEANVRADEAQMQDARLLLDFARITSPIDGITGIRLVDPGNLVRASDTTGIVVVTQIDPIAVVFTLPQDELPAVMRAMDAAPEGKLAVLALARDGTGELGRGTLALVDNQIDTTTSTIRLKAIFPNPKRTLWPNQFVKARLELEVRKGALVVPASAVERGPSGPFVYVIGADQTVAARPIQIAALEGEHAVVGSGLEEGAAIVTDGGDLLRPGSRVVTRGPEPRRSR